MKSYFAGKKGVMAKLQGRSQPGDWKLSMTALLVGSPNVKGNGSLMGYELGLW